MRSKAPRIQSPRQSPPPTAIEVEDSEDEVEELTPNKEIERMREEERFGHYYRVQDRQLNIEHRMRGAIRERVEQDPESC